VENDSRACDRRTVTPEGPRSDAGSGLRMRLYVVGASPNSARAVDALRSVFVEFSLDASGLEIIDVLHEPERGVQDGIVVTPMLVKHGPLPERRLLGNLSDRKALLDVLGLHEVSSVGS
jgi:circadian clock protein KaiB